LRAVESLATSVPFFLLLFAATYVVLAELSASNFGGHLTHTDGLYFTVTMFSTVGFGDVTAQSDTARLVVTGQMIADLIILGLAFKVIVGGVPPRRAAQGGPCEHPGPARGPIARHDGSRHGGKLSTRPHSTPSTRNRHVYVR
jgi:hypothetical protein